jgi:hypothetical protein
MKFLNSTSRAFKFIPKATAQSSGKVVKRFISSIDILAENSYTQAYLFPTLNLSVKNLLSEMSSKAPTASMQEDSLSSCIVGVVVSMLRLDFVISTL